jgi:hypothetical protein
VLSDLRCLRSGPKRAIGAEWSTAHAGQGDDAAAVASPQPSHDDTLTPRINVRASFCLFANQRAHPRAVAVFVERLSCFCYDPLLPVATRPAPVTLPA